MLRLETLGRVALSGPGSPDLSQQRRRLALLVLLAARGERGMTRDQLLALLWSERPVDSGRRALDQMLYSLRRALGANLLLGVDPLRLNPEAIGSDLADCERALVAGDLAAVVSLHRGPFLDGFYLRDAPQFERWVESERGRLRARHHDCLERLARKAGAAGDWSESARAWQRLATEDPLSSRIALAYMRALVSAGDRAAAVNHARVHEASLRKELDVDPDPAVMGFLAELREGGGFEPSAPGRIRSPVPDPESARADARRDPSAAVPVDPSYVETATSPSRILIGPPAEPRPRHWRYVTAGMMVAVAGFLSIQAFGIGPGFLGTRGSAGAKLPLLVTDFRVTGLDSMTGVAAAMAIRTALGESPVVTLYPADSVADALRRMRQPETARLDLQLARELGKRAGIEAIVDGHIIRVGSGYDVGLRLVSAESGEEPFGEHRVAATADDILPVLDTLSRALRANIGESRRSLGASSPLPRVTTPSLEALRLFAAGVEAGFSERAVHLLREATRVDAEFAMAYRRLGVVLATLRLPDPDSSIRKAYAHRAHLTERERLAVTAQFYSLPGHGGDRPKAIEAYERLIALGDTTVAVNLASIYRFRRQYARSESVAVLVANACRCPYPWDDVLSAQIDAGNLEAAERSLGVVRATFPDDTVVARKWTLYMRYHRGDLDAFEHGVDSMRALPDPDTRRTWSNIKRNIALTRGRLAEAERLRRELALLEGSPDGRRRNDLSHAMQIQLVVRRDTVRAARRLAEDASTALQGRGDAQRFLMLAPYLARIGQPARARELLAHFDRRADSAARRKSLPDRHVALAHIAFAEYRLDDAIAEFTLGDQYPDGPRNPMWYQLSGRLARVHDAAGRVDSAIAHYERWVTALGSLRPEQAEFDLAATLERLGDLHARRGDREGAAVYYSHFIELWKDADPELQPRVARARGALADLGLEPLRLGPLPRTQGRP